MCCWPENSMPPCGSCLILRHKLNAMPLILWPSLKNSVDLPECFSDLTDHHWLSVTFTKNFSDLTKSLSDIQWHSLTLSATQWPSLKSQWHCMTLTDSQLPSLKISVTSLKVSVTSVTLTENLSDPHWKSQWPHWKSQWHSVIHNVTQWHSGKITENPSGAHW